MRLLWIDDQRRYNNRMLLLCVPLCVDMFMCVSMYVSVCACMCVYESVYAYMCVCVKNMLL